MRRLKTIVCSLLLVLTFAAATAPAYAKNPFSGLDCSKAPDSAACADSNQGTSDPLVGSNGLLKKAANIIARLGAIIAVIVIVIGGFMYVMSGGDSQRITTAKDTIVYASVGLIIIAMAQYIIVFILNKL